jgi:asparagine N-glycosylation enzyme membrane subunit Stt3
MTGVRRVASWIHLGLATLVVVGVFVQVYLIGAYLFGAGTGALDAHRDAGFTVHALEVLVLVAALVAWLPRPQLWLSLALALVGTAQIALASATTWTGALHPLFALVVLAIAAQLVRLDLAMRPRRTSRAGSTTRTAASAGSSPASPPTSPGARAR